MYIEGVVSMNDKDHALNLLSVRGLTYILKYLINKK